MLFKRILKSLESYFNPLKQMIFYRSQQAVMLQVMESCVKNCGMLIHDEIATKAFMEELRDLVKQTTDDNIKNKVILASNVGTFDWAFSRYKFSP